MTLWVIKVGTSLLRGNKERNTAEVIDIMSSCISASKQRGDQVVLVSSGAVGLGCHRLGIKDRPQDIVGLQAAAAIGQGHLMALYESSFGRHGYKVAQILLTRSDLGSRQSYRNASKTLKKLLDWEVLPVVNENDTLSAEELKYGDNDTLSALVASAIDADQLILLTDIDRLYSSDPRHDIKAEPITDVHPHKQLHSLAIQTTQKNSWGTGGITTKLAAARIATESGITVHLADGRNPNLLDEILQGSRGGTVFHPHPEPLKNRKSWLAHALVPQGNISLDSGACDAIQNKGASLLLVGIKNVEGNFAANQPVKMLNDEGHELARGISSMSSEDLRHALNTPKNYSQSPVVVHRDVLVLSDELLS